MPCMTLVVGMLKHSAEIREATRSYHKGIGTDLMQVKNLTSKFITCSLNKILSFSLFCMFLLPT